MREFKFKCPVCGQHIKSAASQTGSTVECPTCFQRIVVPQATESDDPKFIVSGTRYTQKNLPADDKHGRSGSKGAGGPKFGNKLPLIVAAVVVLGAVGAAVFLFGGKLLKHTTADETRWVADKLSGAEGTSVYNWKDSAAGIEAVQGRPDGMPVLHLHGMNGHNTVRFTAVTHEFLTVQGSDSPISGAGDYSLAVVFSTVTLGSPGNFYDNTGLAGCDQFGVAPDWGFCINGKQLGAGLGAGNAACDQDVSLYGGAVADGAPHVGIYVRSGDTLSLFLDGAQVASQSGLCTAVRGGYNFQIGTMTTDRGFFTGDIAELQIYKHALTADEVQKLSASLETTYGVGTPAVTKSEPVQPAPATVNPNPALPPEISSGRIGVSTWDTQVAVSNIVVTSGGQVLYSSDFSASSKPKSWTLGTGRWVFGSGLMEQLADGQGTMAVAGEDNWSNYVYKAQVAKLSGAEGFILLFNFKNVNNYAQFNIGGWGNTLTGVEYVLNGNKTTGPRVPGSVKMNQWYNVELDVNNNNVRCYLDGQLIMGLGNY